MDQAPPRRIHKDQTGPGLCQKRCADQVLIAGPHTAVKAEHIGVEEGLLQRELIEGWKGEIEAFTELRSEQLLYT